jgi:6-pyruvoyltetrahydropterin/6-carboxytetrahydropterin synthase
MKAELVKTFAFEAAHNLPGMPAGHKCRNMHGHSYRVDIHVAGMVDPQTHLVIDFGIIKQTVEPVIDQLDHRCLNEVPGLANPTSEMISKYLWDNIKPALPQLTQVVVWESDTSRCIYCGQ